MASLKHARRCYKGMVFSSNLRQPRLFVGCGIHEHCVRVQLALLNSSLNVISISLSFHREKSGSHLFEVLLSKPFIVLRKPFHVTSRPFHVDSFTLFSAQKKNITQRRSRQH